MQTEFPISQKLREDIDGFFTSFNVSLLKENLRRLLIDFLDYGLNAGVPLYFDEFFYSFNSLLNMLELVAEEQTAHHLTEKAKNEYAPKLTPLQMVVKFIKNSINPERIFLLYHFSEEGKREYVDLLVVIPAASTTSFTYYEQVLTMRNFENIEINISLHKAEMIEQQLREGHVFYMLVCNRQNLLYENSQTPFAEPDKADLAAIKDKATQTFNAAVKKAESFLNGAKEYYGSNNAAMAAFMLQQSVELSLYALITALLGHCPKTHYFKELKKPLRRCAPELQYVISPNEDEENRLLLLLEKAYLESRYANNFSISDNDVLLLMQSAEVLHEKVEGIFEEKMKRI